ncbi:hypothetical protein WOLCODRAFT_82500 [Wolfiporia cocos MD-104 SS10]|uniref:Uncharacterized protein n=1 Tax=Wolfiporia cocos (strain MD-104) TaxID=742152 RepID=A0A2H3JKT6_WOLCO|nr:hypothetical protein WOLCODRAFT_82500 [Wolfiporia cocos MD-104 SS10]
MGVYYISRGSQDKSVTVSITLPWQLQRPCKQVLTNTRLVQINSTLGKVPIEYVQDKLTELGPTMACVTMHSQINAEVTMETILPCCVHVRLKDTSTEPPMHVLTMHQHMPNVHWTSVSLIPTHDIVWAANSTMLPKLGCPHRALPSALAPGSEITLPVIPMHVADVPTFPMFMNYIYTKRVDILFVHLMSDVAPNVVVQTAPHAIVAYAKQLTTMCSVATILAQVQFVHGIYKNAIVFGVYDAGLWATLDLTWEILLHMLAFVTGVRLDGMESVHDMAEDDIKSPLLLTE